MALTLSICFYPSSIHVDGTDLVQGHETTCFEGERTFAIKMTVGNHTRVFTAQRFRNHLVERLDRGKSLLDIAKQEVRVARTLNLQLPRTYSGANTTV